MTKTYGSLSDEEFAAAIDACVTGKELDVQYIPVSDPVHAPSHYKNFPKEVKDIIRFVLGEEGYKAYCIGCEIKYRLRAGFKSDASEDIAKAMKYFDFRTLKPEQEVSSAPSPDPKELF